MEIKIKNNGEYIPATLEVVDGVMIVSPVKDKDISQFKDGDVVALDSGIDIQLFLFKEWVDTTSMLSLCYAMLDYETGLDIDGGRYFVNRIATEEEKQKLFDALAKEGKSWDSEKKAVVELKWKPKDGEKYYYPYFDVRECDFIIQYAVWSGIYSEENGYRKGWVFPTKEECEAYCLRLNEVINEVKP